MSFIEALLRGIGAGGRGYQVQSQYNDERKRANLLDMLRERQFQETLRHNKWSEDYQQGQAEQAQDRWNRTKVAEDFWRRMTGAQDAMAQEAEARRWQQQFGETVRHHKATEGGGSTGGMTDNQFLTRIAAARKERVDPLKNRINEVRGNMDIGLDVPPAVSDSLPIWQNQIDYFNSPQWSSAYGDTIQQILSGMGQQAAVPQTFASPITASLGTTFKNPNRQTQTAGLLDVRQMTTEQLKKLKKELGGT